ncbi:protein kinase domain-containing protein [Rickettsia endosymbiont of Cardiosporidium cionae]|uniref:protein kinase domain-containing protein n=1 Tax=Rickettsia endosymbiont of Cardiosporidium cionae TaxID=2777155 RepID=UPI001893CA57|nr:hypothetical protein [Rickettsia endosymbiont of Cardiosporidium cionae]KAF8818639.1 hypothetical protein IHI24_000361 [Rickettsia endosymbiont of Cardiosporidium cionae]
MYPSINRSSTIDVVNDLYKIDLAQHIYKLSNDFCDYYCAFNIHNSQKYFAIIYKNNFLVPVEEISKLVNFRDCYLNNVIDYSIVRLSRDHSTHLVSIVEYYDYHDNLTNIFLNNRLISKLELETLISSLTELMSKLGEVGIYGYNIHSSNIILKNDNGPKFLLREFITSYKYYYQPNHYIAPEFLFCHPAGRRPNSVKGDIYALGILVFSLLSKQSPWDQFENTEDYNIFRLEHTTYKTIVSEQITSKIPNKMQYFLQSTLEDKISTRSDLLDIVMWQSNNNNQKFLYRELFNKNHYPLVFSNKKYYSVQAIAYVIFKNWQHSSNLVNDVQFKQWIANMQILNNIPDFFYQISSAKQYNNIQTIVMDLKFCHLLAILDSEGCIRIKNIGVTAVAIPELFYHFMITKQFQLAEELFNYLIKESAWKYYSNTESIGYVLEKHKQLFAQIVEHYKYYSSRCNLETVLYMLNPNIGCISSILNQYIDNISVLLTELEEYSKEYKKTIYLDQYVISFIMYRLKLENNINPTIGIQKLSALSKHYILKFISIINLLHSQLPRIPINSLCNVITDELKILLSNIVYDTKLKNSMIKRLDKIATLHDIKLIAKFLISSNKLVFNDNSKYIKVKKKLQHIKKKMKDLTSNKQENYKLYKELGENITIITSYILLAIIILVLTVKNI